MYLRRHLEGSRLERITRPKVSASSYCTLPRGMSSETNDHCFLLWKPWADTAIFIVVNQKQNIILNAIKSISAAISRYRQVLPGLPYKEPTAAEQTAPIFSHRT